MEAKAPRIFAEEAADLSKGVIGGLVGVPDDPVPDDPVPGTLAEGAAVPVAVGEAEPVELLLLLRLGKRTLENCHIS